MRSFEHDTLLEAPISHGLLMAVRGLGEFRGRQVLYARQSPEVLETLRRVAIIQSTESSNRIEGVTVAADRLEPLVARKVKPKGRSEQEVAGYRDVLASIHADPARQRLSMRLILSWHGDLYRFTDTRNGHWKQKDNAIIEVGPDGHRRVRFRAVAALATPKYMQRLIELHDELAARNAVDPLLRIATFILDFECVHPFTDGNGRMGRLLTLLLLYQAGYEVGRYVSLERIVEESKETYYEALHRSSQGWHEGAHDLRPWWEYFLGMLTAAYKEFEARVGTITSARGAKREMVYGAIRRMSGRFSIGDLLRTCPGVSHPTLKRALADLRREKAIRCLGKGRDAQWEHFGSGGR